MTDTIRPTVEGGFIPVLGKDDPRSKAKQYLDLAVQRLATEKGRIVERLGYADVELRAIPEDGFEPEIYGKVLELRDRISAMSGDEEEARMIAFSIVGLQAYGRRSERG